MTEKIVEQSGFGSEPRRENERRREVVRAFLVQSRHHRDVLQELRERERGGEKFTDILQSFSFTQVILSEKNEQSTENAGQVIPFGGRKRAGENDVVGMANRLLGKAHLRAQHTELLLKDPVEYTLQHTKSGELNMLVKYFLIELSPTDFPNSLDPESSKIDTFVALKPDQFRNLWQNGELTILVDGVEKRVIMQGALLGEGIRKKVSNEEDRIFRTSLDEENIQRVDRLREATFNRIDRYEQLKKRDLMEKIIYFSQGNIEETTDWGTFILLHANKKEFRVWFESAIELCNYEEELKRVGKSRAEAILRFMYTLMELRHGYDLYIEKARAIPHLSDFVDRLDGFVHALRNVVEHEKNKKNPFASTMLKGFGIIDEFLKDKDDVDGEAKDIIEEEFIKAFELVDNKSVRRRLGRIDWFLNDMVRKGASALLPDTHSPNSLLPLNETQSVGVVELLQWAIPTREKLRAMKEKNPEIRRQLVFEARRKLALLYLLKEVELHHTSVVEKQNEPIERLWGGCMKGPSVNVGLNNQYTESGMLEQVRCNRNLPKKSTQNGGKEGVTTSLRKVELRGCKYLMQVDVRLKLSSSIFRKYIERGDDDVSTIRDTYGRLIVVEAEHEQDQVNLCRRETRKISLANKKSNWEIQETDIEDVVPVLDIVEGIIAEAKNKKQHVDIFDYKPTPKIGERIKSNSAGGGGNVRYAKFYIRHVDRKGVERFEEVQVFTPSEDGKSAFYHKKRKEIDDERYAKNRLRFTESFHSFIELMWPHAIYGDVVRQMFREERNDEEGGDTSGIFTDRQLIALQEMLGNERGW